MDGRGPRDYDRRMSAGVMDDSQRRAARVVGWSYLLALPPAVFTEFYVRTRLIVPGDAAETAHRIVAHAGLFRLGIASNLTVFAIDIVLITALYSVLAPFHRRLALLGAGWGLLETATLVVTTLTDIDVLRILSGADYMQAFRADQVAALARLSLGAHDGAYRVALVLAGLRSTLFCWLWLRSRYIPAALALWGIVASVLMGASAFAFILFPGLIRVISPLIYGAPIFLFELTMGFWLVIRGARAPAEAAR
jgi:hypothetical protein